jgi:GT2 family glycosyltransferase
MVDLSIVILNWNVRDLLRQCLKSVYTARRTRYSNHRRDNAPVMTVSRWCAPYPDVHLMVNAANRGYAGGNNDGTAAAERYVLILNPDTQVVGDALSALVAYAEAHRTWASLRLNC